jgi:beta-ureidopropionase
MTSQNKSRIVKTGIIQLANCISTNESCETIRTAMIEAHLPYIEQAAQEGTQILCFQEIFNGPYFCPSQDSKWYGMTEEVPNGPTVQLMQKLAKKHKMVIIVPIYEKEMSGVYYNTAAVIDADGSYLGKYRKNHIPQVSGFWEKFFFKPGNLGYPVFQTAYAKVGVSICYDRHFPEGARALGLNGAEIVFNPSATVAGLSQYLWELEQPAHAAANGYYIAAINRVGTEAPWNIGEFYGSSYFANPRGKIIAQASPKENQLLTAELDLTVIDEVRNLWQFYRDRRPETYGDLLK